MKASTLFGVVVNLVLFPLLMVLIPIIFLYVLPSIGISILYPIPILILVIDLYTLIFYIMALLQRVVYSDLKVLDMVVIPNAPREIKNTLKKTTSKTYQLINVELISCLCAHAKKPLIQSKIVKQVQGKGVDLTSTQIIKYLKNLEKMGIIRSLKGMYKREYNLTEIGKWCCKAVKVCFPRRQFWFIIRHYLGHRSLPPYPEANVRANN